MKLGREIATRPVRGDRYEGRALKIPLLAIR